MYKIIKGQLNKSSLFSYMDNFLISVNIIIFLFLLNFKLNIFFTLNPSNILDYIGVFTTSFLLLIISLLFLESIIDRKMRSYIVSKDGITKTEGFFVKKEQTILYSEIKKINIHLGLFGRIFNFGSIILNKHKKNFEIKNIKNPLELEKIIQQKIKY